MVTRVLLISICALSLYGQCMAQTIGKIAFFSDRDGNREIYLMDADGSNPVNLSNSPETFDSQPKWSLTSSSTAIAKTSWGGVKADVSE